MGEKQKSKQMAVTGAGKKQKGKGCESPASPASTTQMEEPPYDEPPGTERLLKAVVRAKPFVEDIGFELAEAVAVMHRRFDAPPGVTKPPRRRAGAAGNRELSCPQNATPDKTASAAAQLEPERRTTLDRPVRSVDLGCKLGWWD